MGFIKSLKALVKSSSGTSLSKFGSSKGGEEGSNSPPVESGGSYSNRDSSSHPSAGDFSIKSANSGGATHSHAPVSKSPQGYPTGNLVSRDFSPVVSSDSVTLAVSPAAQQPHVAKQPSPRTPPRSSSRSTHGRSPLSNSQTADQSMLNHVSSSGINSGSSIRSVLGGASGTLKTALRPAAMTRQASVPLIHPTRESCPSSDVDVERERAAHIERKKADFRARIENASKRQTSLKHLLHLDRYDFVSDVNVVDARINATVDLNSMLAYNGRSQSASGPAPGGPRVYHQSLLSTAPNIMAGMASSGCIFSEVSAIPDPDSECEATYLSATGDVNSEDGVPELEESNVLAVSVRLPPNMRRAKWSVEDYKPLKKLHKGYASEVFVAQCKQSKELVVLKVYSLADQCDLQRVQLYREIRLHSRLQHHNIVQFYASFLESNCVIIVQEYCKGGDLLKVLYKCGGRLLERQAVNLVMQPCLQALQYLHAQGIVHRDIKPENVLFTDNKTLKVCDFGLAIDLNEERANTRAGTLDYMAPEVLKCPTKKTPDENKQVCGSAHYNTCVDSWAVGAFAYELVTGSAPFKAEEMIQTARNIVHSKVQFPSSLSDMARDFISQALAKHPGDRPTVMEMLHHPWVTMFQRRGSTLSLSQVTPPDWPRLQGSQPSSPAAALKHQQREEEAGHHSSLDPPLVGSPANRLIRIQMGSAAKS